MTTLGERLKKLRQSRNYTLEQLAELLTSESTDRKINKGLISRWEKDEVEPRISVLRGYCSLFDVSLDYLLGRTDVKRPLSEKEEFEAFANNPEMERWYRSMPEDEESMERLYEIWKLFKEK